MKHDISRNTFEPRKHFSRVLKQQGRVDVEADWNEQASIFVHYLRTLATDLIGPYGGPELQCGFEIIDVAGAKAKAAAKKGTPWDDKESKDIETLVNTAGFFIGPGRYYVDGLLCENDGYAAYYDQSDWPFLEDEKGTKVDNCIAYLDVWERLITAAEDDSIREVALDGPDTATRVKVVWQVKLWPMPDHTAAPDAPGVFLKAMKRELPQLRAQLKKQDIPTDACIQSPDSRYRGAENQLYRVEIHQVTEKTKTVTFKWSRENGSVVFPVTEAPTVTGTQTSVQLAHLGRDRNLGLTEEDWVELVDDDSVVQERAEALLQVHSIQRDDGKVILSGATEAKIDPKKHALLRRWDHQDKKLEGGAVVIELKDENPGAWLDLEAGVQVQFQLPKGGSFRTGDYWLIPARTEGGIQWPDGEFRPPRGIIHHYAPLALFDVVPNVTDCRKAFKAIEKITTPIEAVNLDGERDQPE